MEHIITAVFDPGKIRTVASEPLFQWDYGQTLVFSGIELPTAYQVDFSNFEYCGNSIPQIGGADGVTVPVDVLTTGRDVYAFVWLQDAESGRTRYMAQIPVIPRPVPDLDDPNPEQESAIAEAIAALNAGVAAAERSAEDAGESAEDAEAWAVGERGGVPVGADDPAYENNAKYYAEQAGAGSGLDYNGLQNKPQVNGVELKGNKTAAQLGLVAAQQGAGLITDAERQQIQDNADDISAIEGEAQSLQDDVDAIEAKIPNQASAQNQLADKDFVNSSINSSTAFFRGSFASRAALLAVAWQTSDPSAANYVSNNDYAYVEDDETQSDEAWRYIYVLEAGGQNNGWRPQFRVNESPLTAAQVAALNSGATAANIASIAEKYVKPSGGIPKSDLASAVRTSLGKADSALQSVPSTYRTAAAQDTIDAGKIDKPSSPASGAFLVWNGSAWVAQTLAVWQGGSY